MPTYLYSEEDGLEIGPFTAKSRKNAEKIVKEAFKRDFENGEIPDLNCLQELTEKQLDNINRNYLELLNS